METIITAFLKKEPRFPKEFEFLFEKYCRKGGGSEDERLDKAKVFRNLYELYMYAFFLGIRKKKPIQWVNRNRDMSGIKVWNIENWKPHKKAQLRDYLVCCVLAEDGTALREYDLMDEKTIANKSSELLTILEEYTYGGLSILNGAFKKDKNYFDETFAFTEYVFE